MKLAFRKYGLKRQRDCQPVHKCEDIKRLCFPENNNGVILLCYITQWRHENRKIGKLEKNWRLLTLYCSMYLHTVILVCVCRHIRNTTNELIFRNRASCNRDNFLF